MSDQERSAESSKPLFVDNRDGNTLARAITTHLAALRGVGRLPAELCVASCYFNPQGLELIAREARHLPRFRLLLGADPTPEALLPRRTPYDPTEPEFTRRRVGQGRLDLLLVDGQGVLWVILLPFGGKLHPEIVRTSALLGLAPCGLDVLLPEENPHELRMVGPG